MISLNNKAIKCKQHLFNITKEVICAECHEVIKVQDYQVKIYLPDTAHYVISYDEDNSTVCINTNLGRSLLEITSVTDFSSTELEPVFIENSNLLEWVNNVDIPSKSYNWAEINLEAEPSETCGYCEDGYCSDISMYFFGYDGEFSTVDGINAGSFLVVHTEENNQGYPFKDSTPINILDKLKSEDIYE